MDEYISVSEFAKKSEKSKQTIYNWIKNNTDNFNQFLKSENGIKQISTRAIDVYKKTKFEPSKTKLDFLEKELDRRDKQIRQLEDLLQSSDEKIRELTDLLKSSMDLLKSSNETLRVLMGQQQQLMAMKESNLIHGQREKEKETVAVDEFEDDLEYLKSSSPAPKPEPTPEPAQEMPSRKRRSKKKRSLFKRLRMLSNKFDKK